MAGILTPPSCPLCEQDVDADAHKAIQVNAPKIFGEGGNPNFPPLKPLDLRLNSPITSSKDAAPKGK